MISSIITKRGLSGALAIVGGLLVFVSTASAQVEVPSQVSIQGTALVTKNTTNDAGGTNRATKTGGLLLGYSYQFNRWAGVEGNYGYTRNVQNFTVPSGSSSLESDFHQVTGAFVAHIPTSVSKIRPYALAGAGALVFDPTDRYVVSGAERQTKGAFVYGAGVNFDINHYFGVRGEYRGYVYKIPDFNVGSLNLDKVTHLAQPSAGIYFRF
jgi:opacity protein-like surface antigen